jgi:hypothetical protein
MDLLIRVLPSAGAGGLVGGSFGFLRPGGAPCPQSHSHVHAYCSCSYICMLPVAPRTRESAGEGRGHHEVEGAGSRVSLDSGRALLLPGSLSRRCFFGAPFQLARVWLLIASLTKTHPRRSHLTSWPLTSRSTLPSPLVPLCCVVLSLPCNVFYAPAQPHAIGRGSWRGAR